MQFNLFSRLRWSAAAALGALMLVSAPVSAQTAPKDVDLLFVIDRSGSMGNEFSTLADNIEDFFNLLTADVRTGSVAGGLVSYLSTPRLDQAITTNVLSLKAAISGVSVGGGTERGLDALEAGLPGGSLFASAGWRNNTVKSFVLITDEDDDGAENYSAVGNAIKGAGYLNNIIVSSGGNEYGPSAVPTGAVFNLNTFTGNPAAFFADFASAKLTEIETTPTTPAIPLPASVPLLLSGLGMVGALRLRRKTG
jgi:hypothetical protein